MPEIVQRILSSGLRNRPGIKRTPKYIVMHNTANPGATALGHASYLENLGRDPNADPKSWHYTVDDVRIVQHLPLNEAGFHASDGRNGPGNRYGIGIEVCEFDEPERQKAADENAAWLVARLLRQYGWSLDHVKTHQEFAPWKKCPRKLLPKWEAWLDRVRHYMGEVSTVAQPVLRRGSRGPAVKRLQEALIKLGYKLPRYGADGVFGAETEAAVRAFQAARKLKVDGIVGPQTWTALDKALAALQKPKLPKNDEGDKEHWVIAGVFRDRGNAERKVKALKADGHDAWIDTRSK